MHTNERQQLMKTINEGTVSTVCLYCTWHYQYTNNVHMYAAQVKILCMAPTNHSFNQSHTHSLSIKTTQSMVCLFIQSIVSPLYMYVLCWRQANFHVLHNYMHSNNLANHLFDGFTKYLPKQNLFELEKKINWLGILSLWHKIYIYNEYFIYTVQTTQHLDEHVT